MFINGKEFLTVADMASKSGKSKDTIKHILHREEIIPISKDALYPAEVYKLIENAPGKVGRPKKK